MKLLADLKGKVFTTKLKSGGTSHKRFLVTIILHLASCRMMVWSGLKGILMSEVWKKINDKVCQGLTRFDC